MKEEGEGIMEHLSKKYGPGAAARFNDPNSHLLVMGRKVGIEFNNERRMANTKRAHALMEFLKAKDNEKANQFMEDMYRTYFVDGKDLNDIHLLMELVKPYGVDETQAQVAMADDKLQAIAAQDQSIKRSLGVSGVPFFMIEHASDRSKSVSFSGAYPAEVIAEQLQSAADVEDA